MATYNPHTKRKIDCCPDDTPTEMPTPVVRERWFICNHCDHFKEAQCDLISVDLGKYIRGVASVCHIGNW